MVTFKSIKESRYDELLPHSCVWTEAYLVLRLINFSDRPKPYESTSN